MPQTSTPRRFQFSLRTLLVVVTLSAGLFGWVGMQLKRARQQRDVVLAIQNLGGSGKVYYGFDDPFPNFINPANQRLPPGPKWLRDLVGIDCLCPVIGAQLGAVTDTELECVRRLPSLRHIHFCDDNSVTDTGLKYIGEVTSLEELQLLASSRITDAGLEHLNGLVNLRRLSILGSGQVTDAGLKHLQALKSLRLLSLVKTQVTSAGVADLQRALPNCKVCGGRAGWLEPFQ